MDPATVVASDVTQEEIDKIYAEVDAQAPVDNSDENGNDDSQPAPEPKEKTAPEPQDEQAPAPEQSEEEKQAAEETAAKELSDRAVKLGLAEGSTIEEVEAKEAESKAADDVVSDEVINEHAIKHSMTYAEAKADIQATKAIIKNYKSPEEIARALRSATSAYDKLKSQTEKKPAEQVFQRIPDEQFLVDAKQHFSKVDDKGRAVEVERYRQKWPAKTELMSDEAIVEELAALSLNGYRNYAQQQEGQVKGAATKKREQALANVAPEDRPFLPAVKAILDETSDRSILSEHFDMEDLIRHARGEKTSYKAAIKAAEERGAKREREKSVIVGAKDTTTGGGQKPKVPIGNAGATLSQAQKERAEEMFPIDRGYTKDKAYSEFRETFKDELKKNKDFVY